MLSETPELAIHELEIGLLAKHFERFGCGQPNADEIKNAFVIAKRLADERFQIEIKPARLDAVGGNGNDVYAMEIDAERLASRSVRTKVWGQFLTRHNIENIMRHAPPNVVEEVKELCSPKRSRLYPTGVPGITINPDGQINFSLGY